MGGDNRSRKRSGASSNDSNPANKKAKTGIPEARNDKNKMKNHKQAAAKKEHEKSKSPSNFSKVVGKPFTKLTPQSGKNYSGKVVDNGRKNIV
jgi:hypothetical protein